MPTTTLHDWNQHYLDGNLPWDSGRPSKELIRVLDEEAIKPGRAGELGCGTGTNAIYLASRGFDVTAFDLSPAAVATARQNAAKAGAKVEFVEADLCRFTLDVPFDFLFDRGCYHAARRIDQPGFIATLKRLTRPGTRFLLLAGNANEKGPPGPPTVTAAEICNELEPLFEIQFLREFRFAVPNPQEGFLAWSCLMTRRAG
ncbi:MAG TPA: class I SAM-dependent methyltransferase [Planctomycetaceae bacterium]|jgi:SAM-dependent methyltransferase|nr:class I SAM-dependent methyltransferase [Planctomycetaceae bacterium]